MREWAYKIVHGTVNDRRRHLKAIHDSRTQCGDETRLCGPLAAAAEGSLLLRDDTLSLGSAEVLLLPARWRLGTRRRRLGQGGTEEGHGAWAVSEQRLAGRLATPLGHVKKKYKQRKGEGGKEPQARGHRRDT